MHKSPVNHWLNFERSVLKGIKVESVWTLSTTLQSLTSIQSFKHSIHRDQCIRQHWHEPCDRTLTGISLSISPFPSILVSISALSSSLRFSLSFSWQTVVLQCNNTCNLIARWHESRWRKLFHVTALIKTKTITPTPTAAQRRLCICVCIYWSVSENKCLFLSVLTNRSLIFQAFIFLSVIDNLLGVFFSCRLCFPGCLSVCLSFSLSLSSILRSLLCILGSSCQIDNATEKCQEHRQAI